MPWNLLVLPLIGGYYIISRSNRFKYKQQRLDKQRLIFDSVFFGILTLAFTIFVRFIVEYFIPDLINIIYPHLPIKIPFIGTSIASLLFAILITEFGNKTKYKDRRKQINRAIKKVGNELEILLKDSFNNGNLLEFTLDTNKVYVGWVKELPIPTVTTYIRIIPVFSGYRNEQKKLFFTTQYLSVYSKYINESENELNNLDVDLIVTLDDLVTVSYFDIEMYEKFNKETAKEPLFVTNRT